MNEKWHKLQLTPLQRITRPNDLIQELRIMLTNRPNDLIQEFRIMLTNSELADTQRQIDR